MTSGARALILWADQQSTNLGVRVLAEGNRRLVEAADHGIEVDFQSYGSGPAPRPIGLRSLLVASLGLDSSVRRWLSSYSVVLDSGAGDSFTDIYGIRRLLEMSMLRHLVARSGVTLVLGPQTVGPFNTRIGRCLARWSTRSARLILARDSQSLAAANSLGLTHARRATDAVFALPQPVDLNQEGPPTTRTLLNVSGLLWAANPHVDSVRYQEVILQLAAELDARGHRVVLFAHVLASNQQDDDVRAVAAAHAELKSRGLDLGTIVPDSLGGARIAIHNSRLVVAARMHACLNALSVGVPTIALAYSRKFRPLMEDLGWKSIVDLDQCTEVVVDSVLSHCEEIESGSSDVGDVVDRAAIQLQAAVRELSRVNAR